MNGLRYLMIGMALSLASAGAWAQAGEEEVTARGGVLSCGGTHFLRLGGSEIHFTTMNLRNHSATTPIRIDRVLIFDAQGAVLFDSNTAGFPVADNSVLGPADQVLEPKQTAQLTTTDFLDFVQDESRRPFQMEVTWSAAERVVALHVSATRLVRQRDPLTGAQQAERSRDSGRCVTLRLRR